VPTLAILVLVAGLILGSGRRFTDAAATWQPRTFALLLERPG
jgi:hypothetical protein